MGKPTPEAAPAVPRLDAATVNRALEVFGDDGHSIMTPGEVDFLPVEAVVSLARTHHSNFRDPKRTVFKDGQPVKSSSGIYSLDALWWLARCVQADTTGCESYGRGTEARRLTARIREALAAERVYMCHTCHVTTPAITWAQADAERLKGHALEPY